MWILQNSQKLWLNKDNEWVRNKKDPRLFHALHQVERVTRGLKGKCVAVRIDDPPIKVKKGGVKK